VRADELDAAAVDQVGVQQRGQQQRGEGADGKDGLRPGLVELALALAVPVAIALQVRIEEGVLRRDLGAPYLAYQRRVNRWAGRSC